MLGGGGANLGQRRPPLQWVSAAFPETLLAHPDRYQSEVHCSFTVLVTAALAAVATVASMTVGEERTDCGT